MVEVPDVVCEVDKLLNLCGECYNDKVIIVLPDETLELRLAMLSHMGGKKFHFERSPVITALWERRNI